MERFETNLDLISTFIHSASLNAFRTLLDARALPAFPILDASILHWWLGAFRMALHVAIDAVAQNATVLANHTIISF